MSANQPRLIESPRAIAAAISIAPSQLFEIVENVESHYEQFDLSVSGKRKRRHLDNPKMPLKFVQARLKRFLVERISLPAGMVGGVAGGSPLKGARSHVGKSFVAGIDIKDCFPSISNQRVFDALCERAQLGPRAASLVTKLTTVGGRLPQGSPTSTILANAALVPLFHDINAIALHLALDFSQYVDDIALSGERAPEAIDPVLKKLTSHGFTFSSRKVTLLSRGQSQQVTGIGVNNKPAIPRSVFKKLHDEVLKEAHAQDQDERRIRNLWGRINYVRGVSACQGANLLRLADRLLPRPNRSIKTVKRQRVEWMKCSCAYRFSGS